MAVAITLQHYLERLGVEYELVQHPYTETGPVSYTHLTLPTTCNLCRSRWSPYH